MCCWIYSNLRGVSLTPTGPYIHFVHLVLAVFLLNAQLRASRPKGESLDDEDTPSARPQLYTTGKGLRVGRDKTKHVERQWEDMWYAVRHHVGQCETETGCMGMEISARHGLSARQQPG